MGVRREIFGLGLFLILLSTLGVNFQTYGQDEATCEERYDIWKRVGTEEFYKLFTANADMRYCVSLYAFGYYEDSTSKNIKDFLTFIDPAGKFKIQYPSDWNPTTPTDNVIKVMFQAPPNPTTLSEIIKVRYAPGNFEATPIDFVDEVLDNIRVYIPGLKIISIDDTTISGLPAKKVVITGQYDVGWVQEMMVFVIKDTDGYILTYTAPPQSFAAKLPNAQKIIHTFELGDFSGEIPEIEHLTENEETSQAITIPDWIRNNAKWWSEGGIGDRDFASGIEFLIKEDIMKIPKTKQSLLNATNISETQFGSLRVIPNEYFIGEDQKINVKITGNIFDMKNNYVEIFLIDPRGFKDKFSTYADGPNGEFSFVLPFDHFSFKGEYSVKRTNVIEDIGLVTFQIKDASEKPISEENTIPAWVKNNADWWSQGLITDDDFVKGIQYLVEQGIIVV